MFSSSSFRLFDNKDQFIEQINMVSFLMNIFDFNWKKTTQKQEQCKHINPFIAYVGVWTDALIKFDCEINYPLVWFNK